MTCCYYETVGYLIRNGITCMASCYDSCGVFASLSWKYVNIHCKLKAVFHDSQATIGDKIKPFE